jgi:hypothetical protein
MSYKESAPPKVVFALTSQGNDFYIAMTRVAVASLRQSNPAMHMIAVCDHETDRAVKQARNLLVSEVDDWMILETPSGDASFRSRYVKTSLRGVIQGPFLFLDSDIFVRGNIGPIFELDADIAGARNHSRTAFNEQVWAQDAANIEAMGWVIGNEVYINSGVLFYNDTPAARLLGAEWHRRWMQFFAACGDHRDQPALNSALYNTKPRLTVLQDRFNAQFKMTPAVAAGASLWHYYSSNKDVQHTRFELLVNDLVRGAKLDKGKIAEMGESTHPWRSENFIDDLAAARVMRRGHFDGWESAWLRREMRQYLFGRTRSAFGRMKRVLFPL